jgi:hypothetical protein
MLRTKPLSCPQCHSDSVTPFRVFYEDGRRVLTQECDDCGHEFIVTLSDLPAKRRTTKTDSN